MQRRKRVTVFILALALLMTALPVYVPAESVEAKTNIEGGGVRLESGDRTDDVYFDTQKVMTVVSKTDSCVFRASIKDMKDNNKVLYISTESTGNVWPANWEMGGFSTQGYELSAVPGHVYRITFTRNGSSYSVEYYDYTAQSIHNVASVSDTPLTDDGFICAYIKAVNGSFEVYDGDPSENGFSAGQVSEVSLNHGVDRTRLVTEDMLKTGLPDPSEYDVSALSTQGKKKGNYSDYFLKDDLQEVRIQIDDHNLDYVLQHADSKAAAMADSVTLGDQTVQYVSLKTKGNFTRTNGAIPSTSDRFSFTVNFSKYIKKKSGYNKTQNFFGLKKVSFNNFYFDKTMMKEYNAMRLMTEMGIPTPEYGLAKLYINDEYYGVYFMVEPMESSILERFYDVSDDDLSTYLTKPSYISPYYYDNLDQYKEDGVITKNSLLQAGLVENADGSYGWQEWSDISWYSGMWENDPETLGDVIEDLPTVFNWMEKLTKLSQGKDFSGNSVDVNSDQYLELLGKVMNIDETLRYFAAQSFVVQNDNLFTWRQNYGLYVDKQGVSQIVPWDYDLAWGYGNTPSDGESVANWNINQIYNDVASSAYGYTTNLNQYYADHPLFNVIWQNNELREKFRTYIGDCAKLATLGGKTSDGATCEAGRFQAKIAELYDQVTEAAGIPLASNAYYLQYDQPGDCEKGLKALSQIIGLRAVGAYIQLNGIDAKVTGYGYPTGCLGNDSDRATYTTSGSNIAVVNTDTGIFAVADYAKGKKAGDTDDGPILSVDEIESTDAVYREIKSKFKDDLDGELVIYAMTNTKAPSSLYQLYIPVSKNFAPDGASVYTYDSGTGKIRAFASQDVTVNDNIYSFTAGNISYVVLLNKAGDSSSYVKEETVDQTPETVSEPEPEPTPAPAPTVNPTPANTTKSAQTITVKAAAKQTAGKSLKLNATVNGGAKLTYSTSAKKIATVDSNGTVKFLKSGKVTITVNAAENASYQAASKTLTFHVVPAAVTLKKLTAGKKKLTVKWAKQSGVDGYEIVYSTKKSFKKSATKTVKVKASKASTVLKKLNKSKKYYVKIRAYKKIDKKTYYGAYSKVLNKKTK